MDARRYWSRAKMQSLVTLGLSAAQIGNLLYRRMAFGTVCLAWRR
jgi:hypothetical protein